MPDPVTINPNEDGTFTLPDGSTATITSALKVAPKLIGMTLSADSSEIRVGDTFKVSGVLDFNIGPPEALKAYRVYGFDKSILSAPNEGTPRFTALATGKTTIQCDNSRVTGSLDVTVLPAAAVTPPSGSPPDPPSTAPPPPATSPTPPPVSPPPPSLPPEGAPPSNDNATHEVVINAEDRTGRVFTAKATVGNDPTAPAIFAPFMGPDVSGLVADPPTAPLNTGNVPHPGLRIKFYADGADAGAYCADNAFDWHGFKLSGTYDGEPVVIAPPTNADGTVDFWRGCCMPTIRYGKQVGWDASKIDWSLYPNYARLPQAPFNDAHMDYTFNGMGCASLRGMASTGDRMDLGYAWLVDMAFLLNACDATWAVVRRASDHDGKWNSVFFCDPKTGGILNIETYPDATTLSKAQSMAVWKNPIVTYRGTYDGDTLTPPVNTGKTSTCTNIPNGAHLTSYAMLAAMMGAARDRDHASFWANWPLLEINPGYRQNGGVVMGPQRRFAWCLRDLFMASYVSSDCDYFKRRVARQLELVNTVPRNSLGILGTSTAYVEGSDDKGFGLFQHAYMAQTFDAVSRKETGWLPIAQYVGTFYGKILQTVWAPLIGIEDWACKDASGNVIEDLSEQVKQTLLGHNFTDAETATILAATTIDQVHAALKAHKPEWQGQCVNGVCDFYSGGDSITKPGNYASEVIMGVVAAYNAGAPDSDKALAYVQALPTKPDYSPDARFHLAPLARAA